MNNQDGYGTTQQHTSEGPSTFVFGLSLKYLANKLRQPCNTCVIQIRDEKSFMKTILELAAQSSDLVDLRKKLCERQTTDLRTAWLEFKRTSHDMLLEGESRFPHRESYFAASSVYGTRSALAVLGFVRDDNPHGLISLLKSKPTPQSPPFLAYTVPAPASAPSSASTPTPTIAESLGHTPPSAVSPAPPPRNDHNKRTAGVEKGRVEKKSASTRKKTSSGQARHKQTRDYWRKCRRRSKTGTV